MRNIIELNKLIDSMKVELEANTKVVVGLLNKFADLEKRLRKLETDFDIVTTTPVDKKYKYKNYNI